MITNLREKLIFERSKLSSRGYTEDEKKKIAEVCGQLRYELTLEQSRARNAKNARRYSNK